MTTVATNGWVMAADGRSTFGSQIGNEKARKLTRLPDGSVVGAAGSILAHQAAVDELTAAINEGRTPKAAKGDYHLLRLMPDGTVQLYLESLKNVYDVSPPFAIGTGEAYAMGAMAAGKWPTEAVKIAMKFDKNSGGRVREMHRQK